MAPTLDGLLRQRSFGLRLVAGAEPGDDALSRPLAWAHSSDLEDPTPWLEPGGLLLTDGAQFGSGPGAAGEDAYVDRLVDRGVAALGFAVGVVHPAIPDRLVAACGDRGLPLVEVDRQTPFMALIRHVGDARSREQRERLEWSLSAQRAVARAAVRPDGLSAVLRELGRQLGCWVVLFDAAGHRVQTATPLVPPPPLLAEVEVAVRRALERGVRGGVRIAADGSDVTLQTLGQHQELRGVLAVGTQTPLDPAATDLVTSVIALASIAVDQSRTIEDARRHLRSGLLELMLAGATDVAERTSQQLWTAFPEPPVRVCVTEPLAGRALSTELEVLAERRRGRLFFAERDGRLVTVSRSDETADLRKIWLREAILAGSSTALGWGDLAEGYAEAQRAVGRASRERPFVRFEDLVGEGLLGALEAAGGETVARRLLQPLHARPAAERQVLLDTVTVWLDGNCAWDPAAKRLGVHRHTLRNRIAAVEALLGLDLDRFADRAELWAAVELDRRLAAGSGLSSGGSPG